MSSLWEMKTLQHHERKRCHLHEGRFSDEDGVRAAELEGEFAELGGWEGRKVKHLNYFKTQTFQKNCTIKNMSEVANGEKVKVLLLKPFLANQTFFFWTSRPTGWTSNPLLG